MKVLP